MTPEEAIEIIETTKGLYKPKAVQDAFDMAAQALKEVQEYGEIGTVEECREAVEKQKMKKSIDYDEDLGYFKCPSCGCCIMADEFSDHKYCLNCGQAIQWKESEEE